MVRIILVLFVTLLSHTVRGQYWSTPYGIREISVTGFNDIVIASFDQMGPIIYYNPQITQQVDPLVSEFFHSHEYGHHNLGHVTAQPYNANNPYVQQWLTLNVENAADAYSVRYHIQNGNTAVLQATYSLFVNSPNNGPRTHPPTVIRAQI